MPELNVAAVTVSAVAPPPSGNVEGVDAGAAEGQSSEPFAAVLQQAAEAAAAPAAIVVDQAALDLVAAEGETPDATGNAELAAILPMLMAIAAPKKRDDAGMAETPALPDVAIEAGEAASALDALPIAGPHGHSQGNTPSPVAALPSGSERAALLNHGQAAQLNQAQTATPTAIPAASSPKGENFSAAELKGMPRQGGFEELLSAAREGQLQTTPGTVSAQSAGNIPQAGPLRVETPVGARGWDTEVGNRLVWMAGRQESHAELVLNPPQMGRIEVSLSISGDQATAQFVSASPAVREALENALPRLRELLADAGVTLGQAQVGSESTGHPAAGERENGDNPPHGPMASAADGGGAGSIAGLVGGTANPWLQTGRGLVDVFA